MTNRFIWMGLLAETPLNSPIGAIRKAGYKSLTGVEGRRAQPARRQLRISAQVPLAVTLPQAEPLRTAKDA